MKMFLLSFVLLIGTSACTQSKSKPITEISQDDLNNVLLVDVRTPEEFEAGHLENAMNVNWYDPDFAKQFEKVDKDKTIYVYCKMGGRSAKAQEKLTALGFQHVINLEGGYDAVKTQNK